MKLKSNLFLVAAALQSIAFAGPLYKINNSDNLNLTSSWTDTSGIANPPGTIQTIDPLYFNEVNMQGDKTLALGGGGLSAGGIAVDYVTTDSPNNVVISVGDTLTLNGATLNGGGAAGAGGSYAAAGIVLNRGTGGNLTINSNVALGANQQWVSGRATGGMTIAGAVNLSTFNLSTNIAAGTSTISGAVSGSGTFTKIGNGVLVLSGDNSAFSGGVTLGAGAAATANILEVGHVNALGTNTFKFRGGVLRASTPGLTLTNAMDVAAGGLRVGGANNFTLSGNLVMENASRSYGNYGTAAVTLGTGGSTLTLGGTTSRLAFDVGGSFIINGNITGTGSNVPATGAIQVTAGRVAFNGANNYVGQTNISGGTITGTGSITSSLINMSGGSIALVGGATTGSALTFGAGATFTGTPSVTFGTAPVEATVYDVFNYTGTLTTLGNLKSAARGTFLDAGTKVTFTAGVSNQARTWNGTTGIWDAIGANANWLEGDLKFYNGDSATFPEPAAAATVTVSGTVSATGFAITNTTNAYIFTGGALTGATGVVKSGTGTATLASAANSFTGNITVNGGTLIGSASSGGTNSTLGLNTSSRSITVNTGGTLSMTTNNILGTGAQTLPNTTKLIVSGGTVTTTNFNVVGDIDLNGGTLAATGGASAAYRSYEFNGSTVTVGGAAASTISATGANSEMHIAGTKTLTLAVADVTSSPATDLNLSAALRDGSNDRLGAGTLLKTGAGTVVSSGANAYTGATTVSGGAFLVSGSSTGGGSITVGSGATFGTTGGGFLGPGGTRTLGITNSGTLSFGSTAAQTVSGLITGAGSLAKSGSGVLTLSAFNDYTGPTAITGGTLAVTGGLSVSSAVSVASGGALSGNGFVDGAVTVNTGGILAGGNAFGHTLSMGSVTFATTGAITISELQNYMGSAPLTSTGNLTVSGGAGSVTVNLPTAPIAAGTYHLIGSSNTLANASQFVLGTAPALGSRQIGGFESTSGFINYVVSGVNPTWTGGFSNEWSIAVMTSPKNWFTNVETDYQTGDAVTFDDSATANFAITLPAVVTPTSVAFNNSFNPYSISGAGGIAGAGTGMVKNGTSSVTLNTANTYGGGTTINAGTLTMGNAGALGSGPVTLGAATLGLGAYTVANNIASTGGTLAGTTFQVNGVISGTSLTINATGIVKFNAVNTYTGATTITAGGLDIIGAGQLNSGTYAGAITNPAILRFSTSANQTLSGGISGAGALVKNNSSTLTLAANNTYSGGTTINGGTLDLTAGGGANGTIRGSATVNAGASLRLSTGDATGYGGGATSLTTINLDGGNLHVNTPVSVANQTLGSAVVNMTGGSITGVANSNLDFFGGGSALNTFASATTSTISGTAIDLRQGVGVTFTVDQGTTPSGVDLEISSLLTNKAPAGGLPGTGANYGSNPFIKNGPGTIRITGFANNYTGVTTINAGTLDLTTTGQLYSGAYYNSTVTVNTGGTLKIKNMAYSETPGSGGSLGGLRDYGDSRMINGGTFEVLGVGHSTGNNFHVGVNGGTFRYAPSLTTDTLALTGNGNSNIAVAGALTLDAVGNVTITEVVEGAGTLTKTGAGTLTLGALNTLAGATTVNAGVLAVNGTALADGSSLVINGGKVAPTGTETVNTLYFAAAQQAIGTYGSLASTATFKSDTYFKPGSTGVINVVTGPPGGYSTWAATNAPLPQTSGQDYDNDGVSNGAEYILGGLATTQDSAKLPVLTTPGGNMVFTFKRIQSSKTPDTSVTIDVGTTLASWTSSYVVGTINDGSNTGSSTGVTVTNNNDGYDVVTLTVTMAPDAKKFARLNVKIN